MYDYPSHYDHGYEDGFDDSCYNGCCQDDSFQDFNCDDEYDCFYEYIYCNNFNYVNRDEYDENDGD